MPDSIPPAEAEAAYAEALKRIEKAEKEQATELNLYDLPLTELPPEIGRLTQLISLYLGYFHGFRSQLEALPFEILQITDLPEFRSQLQTLPSAISKLTNLQSLDLSQNNLSELPPELAHLTNLHLLDLSKNNLNEMPTIIAQIKSLKVLGLNQTSLSQLTSEIAKLTNLQTLELNNNNLTQLPPEIIRLTNLKTLGMSGNNLNQLPPEIVQLTNLQTLELNENNLSHLPSEIIQLTNLQSLDIDKNNLNQIPSVVFQLTSLRSLSLMDNNLTQLPPEISQLTNLKNLYLNRNNHLSQLPPEIFQLSNLQVLALIRTNLSHLPPEIAQLTKLTNLYLRENNLSYLPTQISHLGGLEVLYLSRNKISQVPSEIFRLTNLQRLSIDQNNLRQLPRKIGQLINLKTLNLSQNNLNELPSEIGQLSHLQSLNLSQNNLRQLPREIGQLVNLKTLNLSQNNLNELPPEIIQLVSLQRLYLQGNHKLLLPPELSEQSANPKAILEFWQKQSSQPHRPLNEAKFILVGQGGVGKTSLVQRLLHDRHDLAEVQTKGIDINHHMIAVPRGEETAEIQLNIWDFGGQEIMHATHQFFLTKRSLYLLVLDARQGEQEGRVEYWLALIRSFAADAPILIVINKSDEHYLELNRKALQEKYPSIVGFVHTSARTGAGMDDLKAAITNVLAEMDHIDTPFPQSWIEIKDELQRLQKTRNFLYYHEYQQLCQEQGIDNDSSQRILINFLHDLGVLLNFQDDDRVRDTNILNPQWVTKGVYALLNAEALARQDGLLRREQLPDLLDKEAYPPELHRFILQMMEKFELAFPFEGGTRYLVPDLLPVEEPAFAWDKSDVLNFAYHYAVLPHSILHRFIVRQHTRIHEKIAWRTGVILAHEQMLALIRADIEDKTIAISITGQGRRREFLSMIRFTFDSLHESITGTKPTEQVPVPGYPGVVVPYTHLLTLEEKGIRQQIFPGMDDFVDVRDLLGTIEDPSRRQLQGLTRQELYRLFKEHFNPDELRELCFLLNVDYEILSGDNLMRKSLELVGTMERNGRLPELVESLLEMRPFLLEELQRRRPGVYR